MKRIPVEDLKPGMVFDRPVFTSGNNILVSAFQPLKSSDYNRLMAWGLQYVYTEGSALNKEAEKEEINDLVSEIQVEEEAVDIWDLYYISPDNEKDMDGAERHQEIAEVIKQNFARLKQNKFPDASDLRNAANSLVTLVSKNPALVFKLLMMVPPKHKDFLYYKSVNTAMLSILTGITMKYSRIHLSNLAMGAFLHDVGMTHIPDEIVYKDGKLTEVEFNILRKHPFYGYQLLKKSNMFPNDVLLIVLQHHERLDGSGYPIGIGGSQISEYARIVGISDAYQAMCQPRSYRGAHSPSAIIKMLLQQEAGKLDATILKIFAYTVGVYPIGLMVELENKAIGEVLNQNLKTLTQPTIKMYLDDRGNLVNPPEVVNLATENLKVRRLVSNEERQKILRKLG